MPQDSEQTGQRAVKYLWVTRKSEIRDNDIADDLVRLGVRQVIIDL